ncbi:MAG: aminotransferase class V-fold PLP-dependent enzyme [Bacilli bacterium]|nr:MAG: aminotransferase class V-fold PLP-dependent enzyme [Bacilli bacterium]
MVFTSGTTNGMNMIVSGFFRNYLKKDDEVLITLSEHASNIIPWFILQKEIGIKVKYIPLTENHEVTVENFKNSITDKTKVVSLAYVTNVIGDERPIKEISKIAHDNNIFVVVDAAQGAPHKKIDVQDDDIDFMAFSGHKMYGPTGIGVLYAKFDLLDKITPMNYGGGMNAMFTKDGYVELREIPTRLEGGTPNIEGVLGLGEAISYLENIGMDKINEYEKSS